MVERQHVMGEKVDINFSGSVWFFVLIELVLTPLKNHVWDRSLPVTMFQSWQHSNLIDRDSTILTQSPGGGQGASVLLMGNVDWGGCWSHLNACYANSILFSVCPSKSLQNMSVHIYNKISINPLSKLIPGPWEMWPITGLIKNVNKLEPNL